MKRFHIITSFVLAIAGASMAAEFRKVQAADARDYKPNIVILYADDMGYGDLAIQNPDSKIPTPHLDQLAREGMRFSDGHSSSGICSPSRYALLTGRHHWRTFNGIVQSFGPSVFDEERLTLPEMLQEMGYVTGCIGKWHLGFAWQAVMKPGIKLPEDTRQELPASAFDWSQKVPDGPTAHGFDYYFGDGTPNLPPYGWMENDKMLVAPTVSHVPIPPPPEGSDECRDGPGVAGWRLDAVMPTLTEKAVAWIGEQKGSGKPFFLYFPWTSPHAPIVPAAEFAGTSEAGPYGDYLVQSDWTAGQVLQALKDHGFEDNTVVIFTADNGSENYMMERFLRYGHNSSGPFRGMKRDIYEGGHHVPFVVKWPGVTKPGSVATAITSQVDIMATLANAIGYELPPGQGEDSIDMMPVLKGEKPFVRNALVMNTRNMRYGIRKGDWVFLQDTTQKLNQSRWTAAQAYRATNGFDPEKKPQALYNLKHDIGQRENVIDRYPEKAGQLQELLEQIQNAGYPVR